MKHQDQARSRATYRWQSHSLPSATTPLWGGLMDDCDDTAEVMSMRWFVGDAARMYPPAGPGNLGV